MKDLFVFSETDDLSVIGGKIIYGRVADGDVCTTFEQLIAEAKEFRPPYYTPYYIDKEKKMLDDIVAGLEERNVKANRAGTMEIAFTVMSDGNVENAEVVKGINPALDAAMIDIFQQMRWVPAEYLLKDESGESFECRCVKKIKFPIKKQ